MTTSKLKTLRYHQTLELETVVPTITPLKSKALWYHQNRARKDQNKMVPSNNKDVALSRT